jgi:polyisoprenoid-binding protein YceI
MSTITEQAIPTGTWQLDTTHSWIGFEVVYMGVAPFQGALRHVEATIESGALRGVAHVASIDVDEDNLAAHLRSPEFFDAERFPEIRFESPAIERDGDAVTVDGALAIKGVSRPVTLTGTITGPAEDPWGNAKIGLTLTTVVNRHDFGLSWNAPLPGGGQMLADDVTLTGRLVFVQRAEA